MNYELSNDRFFDPNPAVKKIAQELYSMVKDLPIISPHGHVDPALFAENAPFPNPAELFIIPDHYVFRMLHSQGIPLESLGIHSLNGTAYEKDPRRIWELFAENIHLFRGTPSGVWFEYELSEVLGIKERLDARSAKRIYDNISEKLSQPQFRPRALFERFKIEVLATTDAVNDPLEAHQSIRDSGWNGRVIPTFRPDSVTDLTNKNWKQHLELLEVWLKNEITTFTHFITALEERRTYFRSFGAAATDHGAHSPLTLELTGSQIEEIFQRARKGTATPEDAKLFSAHMLMEMARMSVDDGMVMQLHAGSFRNHDQRLFDRFGPDKGSDIPHRMEYTNNLSPLLNKYGSEKNFTFIVFTLDESTYARELAPLAGHYPSMKLGPAWWFHDSIEGMTRYRQTVMETAGLYNTAGFNDDTRAFLSIPARHDLSRRMDCNYAAGLVARSIIRMEDAAEMVVQMTNGLVKKAYKL